MHVGNRFEMFVCFECSYMYILMTFICVSLLPAEPDSEIVGKYPDNFVTDPGKDEHICTYFHYPNAYISRVEHKDVCI